MISAETAAAVAALMNAKKPVTLDTIARETGLTALEAARALPQGSATFAPGADFEAVWESLCTWEKATLIVVHEGSVFEIAARLEPGKTAAGYYNLMHGNSPVGGHIKADRIAAIGFISLPFMGRESHFAGFFDVAGTLLFSVYVGREKHQLIPEARDAFLALKARYESTVTAAGRLRVVVSSRTGNTREVARHLAAALPGALLENAGEAAPFEATDTVLLGFWIDKGALDSAAAETLAAVRAARCRTALFGTLGGNPASEKTHAFIEQLEGDLRALPGMTLIAPLCMVQGKIDPVVIESMNRMLGDKANDPERLARLAAAAQHPNAGDFATVIAWAQAALAPQA